MATLGLLEDLKSRAIILRKFAAFNRSIRPHTRPTGRPFLDFPPEIRSEIYKYVAASTIISYTPSHTSKNLSRFGLAVTCRQIYREYRLIILSYATIHVHLFDYQLHRLTQALTHTDPNVRAALWSNGSIFAMLHISHVSTPTEEKQLSDWDDARAHSHFYPLTNVRFIFWISPNTRPPRPRARYASQQEVELHVLRSHIRMAQDVLHARLAKNEQPNGGGLEYLVRQMSQEYLSRSLWCQSSD
jgi:hypothetical protein